MRSWHMYTVILDSVMLKADNTAKIECSVYSESL